MKRYQVVKRGHKVGHASLPYGEIVSYRALGCKQRDLEPFIQRGVLKIVKKDPEPTPQNEEVDEGLESIE